MMRFLRLVVSLSYYFALTNASKPILNLYQELVQAKKNWTSYLRLNTDHDRKSILQKAMKKSVGVKRFVNEAERNSSYGQTLSKGLLLTVVESSLDPSNDRYKLMLRNFLCYLQQYNLKIILVLLDDNTTSFTEESADLLKLYPDNVTILPYPFHLFWSLLLKKKSVINRDYNAGDYKGSVPSFKHFGALVTMIPIYEMLREGYNVIYFDIDISFPHDPLPYLLRGDADFIASQELRNCDFPSFIPQHTEWAVSEPNTGVLFLRSSDRSIAFMRIWITEMIEQNKMNDQRILSFKFASHPVHTTSCNGPSTASASSPRKLSTSAAKTINSFKYCFLNEFVFQNGKMEFFCAQGNEGPDTVVFPSAYYLGMERFSPSLALPSQRGSPSSTTLHRNKSHPHSQSRPLNGSVNAYIPVAVHTNFCDDKVDKLRERGLFLFNSARNSCLAFDPGRSSFAKIDWKGRARISRAVLTQELRSLKNGSLVHYLARSNLLYLLSDGRLHFMPAGNSYLAQRGMRLEDVASISRGLFLWLERGPDLV